MKQSQHTFCTDFFFFCWVSVELTFIYVKLYTQGCVTLWPCHFHSKRIIKEIQKISPCKNIIFKKNPPKETKILQDHIITLKLISSFNTSQKNAIFQKSSYRNRPIIIYGPKSLKLATILYNESKHNILAFGRQGQKKKP